MKILYAGPLSRWSTTEARRRALVALGHDLRCVDVTEHLAAPSRVLAMLQRHLSAGPGIGRYNHALLAASEDHAPDLVWLDTGAYVWRRTVAALRAPGRVILAYTSDYLEYRAYCFRHYLRSVPLYDVHVTTNELNVPVLRRRGATRVLPTMAAYDPELHRPVQLSADERDRLECDVAFLGHREAAYERALVALRQAGLSVRAWGPGWASRKAALDGMVQDPPQVWGPDSVKAVMAARIGIGLLSKHNRNQSTGRSFEVPAIGAFLLAERTPEHQSLYREGVEAAFFSTIDELVATARRYVLNARRRQEVAAAGHRRCLALQATHLDRTRQIVSAL